MKIERIKEAMRVQQSVISYCSDTIKYYEEYLVHLKKTGQKEAARECYVKLLEPIRKDQKARKFIMSLLVAELRATLCKQ